MQYFIARRPIFFFCGVILLSCVFFIPSLRAKDARKSQGLNIEEELNLDRGRTAAPLRSKEENEGESKDSITDKATVVEGEDEQFAPPRKSEIELPQVAEGRLSRWEDELDLNMEREKQGTKLVERKANVGTEYGTQNAFGARFYITKREKLSSYLINYVRQKQDYEEFNGSKVAHSQSSSDALTLAIERRFSSTFVSRLRSEYKDSLRGLQNNTFYGEERKRLGRFEWSTQVRPTESQKVIAGVQGTLAQGETEGALAPTRHTANFRALKAFAEWQYIFGERNALTLTGDLHYGENNDYGVNPTMYYRVGNAEVKNVFPLARFVVGADGQALQIDATLGAKIFFAQAMNPVVGPRVAFDFFYPGYQSTLELERTGRLPDFADYYFGQWYQSPYRFTKAEDFWRAAFKNNFHVTKDSFIKANAQYSDYPVYFDRRLDSTQGILALTPVVFRSLEGSLSFAQNFGAYFYHDTGLSAEYFFDAVSLRSPLGVFSKLHFKPSVWDFSVELKYVHRRKQIESITEAQVNLKGYTLLNVGIEAQVTPSLGLFVRGENLLNERWQTVSLYHNSGARGIFGLNIVF